MKNKKICCPMCGGDDLSIIVDVIFNIPIESYRNIEKIDFRKKVFKLLGVDWEHMTFCCEKCYFQWTAEQEVKQNK